MMEYEEIPYVGILNHVNIVSMKGFDPNSEYLLEFPENGSLRTNIVIGKDINDHLRNLGCQGCFGEVVKLKDKKRN